MADDTFHGESACVPNWNFLRLSVLELGPDTDIRAGRVQGLMLIQ